MEKYKVIVLQPALDDLEEIVLYIAKDSKASALKMHDKIVDSVNRLETFPKLGTLVPDRKMSESGLRFFVIDKYLLFYKIYDGEINILRILRGARDYPKLFDKQKSL
jgi:plasmid stabilization system protein ParE